jgi:hypothetical protein
MDARGARSLSALGSMASEAAQYTFFPFIILSILSIRSGLHVVTGYVSSLAYVFDTGPHQLGTQRTAMPVA